MTRGALLTPLLWVILLACESESTKVVEPSEPSEPVEEGQSLGVPPEMFPRARREAAGLARLSPRLREAAIEEQRATLSYTDLRGDPAAHEGDDATFEGQLALVRPAGERLWILALKTRQDGESWTDPLFVLSVIEPPEEGTVARIDGWVVGTRTIGRNTLPLILAYSVSAPAAQ